jgi:hypothetical protein
MIFVTGESLIIGHVQNFVLLSFTNNILDGLDLEYTQHESESQITFETARSVT